MVLLMANPEAPLLWAAPGAPQNRGRISSSSTASSLRLNSSYGHLPLAFEPNQGQADGRAQFLCHGNGYSMSLTSQGMVLSLRKPRTGPFPQSTRSRTSRAPTPTPPAPPDVIGLSWEGAQGSVAYEGMDQLPGVSNYIPGNDRAQWHTNIPQYAKVAAREVYTGTDVTYYGNQGRLEFDFTVRPGADPQTIRLRADGVKKATVTAQGDLELRTAGGKVILRSPTTYQETGGQRKAVTAGYRMGEDGRILFEVGDYDKAKPLVIDPVLDYSSYMGGNIDDSISLITVDSTGNAYVVGGTDGNFPITAGAYQATFVSNNVNMVVAKVNPAGTALLYATYLGPNETYGTGIAVNGTGNVFVMGNAPTGFPTTSGSYKPTSSNGGPFVTELTAAGSALVYSTYLGGSGSQGGRIALSPSGYVYATGTTNGDLPSTAGAYQTAVQGSESAFMAELNPAGGGSSDLLLCTYLGGLGGVATNYATSLALGPGGTVYIAGTAYAGMPVTPGAYQSGPSNATEPFAPYIAVFNSTGTSLLYCTYVGWFYCEDLAVDPSGGAYITGYTGCGFPITAGAFLTTCNTDDDGYVAKVNPNGGGAADLAYSSYLGGSGSTDEGNSIAVDGSGRAYVVGDTIDSDFPTTAGAYQTTRNGTAYNAYLTVVNPQGTALVYSTYFDGTSWDSVADGDALGPDGGIYMVGYAGTNFPITSGVFEPNYGGGYTCGFVTKFDASITGNTPTPVSSPTLTPIGTITGTPTLTPSLTPSPTPTASFTASPTSTVTSTLTVTKTSTPTLTPTATVSPTPTSTSRPVQTPTPTLSYVDDFQVYENVGNPSNPVTIFVDYFSSPGQYDLMIYNSAGEHIKTLDSRTLNGPVSQYYVWDGTNKYGGTCASGVYLITLTEPYTFRVKRVIWVR